jgi:excisionase family DNA binding protein
VTDRDELLTIAEAAAILDVNVRSVRYLVDHDRLPYIQLGERRIRIKRSDLDRITKSDLAPRPATAATRDDRTEAQRFWDGEPAGYPQPT